jgi:hypothetical protein
MYKVALRVAVLGFVVGLAAACSSQGPVDGSDLVGATETGAISDELSGGVPIGTTLVTTANLNLRTGASTSYKILHVIPKGASVVTVNRTTPVNGWYNIKHAGVIGWSYGAYLAKPQSGGGGGGGGSSTARDDAIARASDGVGFSYWWGHGRWLSSGPSSSTKGSCSGSCPSCSHSGGYGADCSGFAAKVWQVPSSNSTLSVDSHPYSTYNFRFESHGWHTISRSNLTKGDALVYHSNGAGHIYIYDHGDPWGSHWAYEAKGCSYGIVHDVRTASSSYIAIRHDGW